MIIKWNTLLDLPEHTPPPPVPRKVPALVMLPRTIYHYNQHPLNLYQVKLPAPQRKIVYYQLYCQTSKEIEHLKIFKAEATTIKYSEIMCTCLRGSEKIHHPSSIKKMAK